MNDVRKVAQGGSAATSRHRGLGALLLELLVVFAGVYGAFALAQWNQGRQDADRRERLRAALLAEVRGTTVIAHQSRAALHEMSAQFEASRLRGEHPVPRPQLGEARADPNVWNATVAAGGINLIDVGTFVQLARFYNSVQAGLEVHQTLKRLSEQQLIPRQGEPPASFYVPGSNELRPEFTWYPALLQQLEAITDIAATRGDSAVVRLEGDPRRR